MSQADDKRYGSEMVPQPHGGALKPAKPGEVRNPTGKSGVHISKHIQDLLNDEDFTVKNFLGGGKEYKGKPIDAIITVAIYQAMSGEKDWAEWLAKHGYTEKNINLTGDLTVNLVSYLDDGSNNPT